MLPLSARGKEEEEESSLSVNIQLLLQALLVSHHTAVTSYHQVSLDVTRCYQLLPAVTNCH